MTGLEKAVQAYLEAQREAAVQAKANLEQCKIDEAAADKDRRVMNRWQKAYVLFTVVIALATILRAWAK